MQSIKMKKIIILLLFISCQISANPKPLFNGAPEFNKLNPDVLTSIIFQNAPSSTGTIFNYVAYEGDHTPYSRYQITRVATHKNITHYITIELPPEGSIPEVKGNGIGYGGIVTLAYEKEQTKRAARNNWNYFYKKYEIVSIDRVQGKLFPLHDGNQLSFHFVAQEKTHVGKKLYNGEIVYKVLRHFNHYNLSKNPVPGTVYVIRMYRGGQENPQLVPAYEYYFSENLGWYIVAKYYVRNKLFAVYHLINWK